MVWERLSVMNEVKIVTENGICTVFFTLQAPMARYRYVSKTFFLTPYRAVFFPRKQHRNCIYVCFGKKHTLGKI
jgi:hypothetical protein